MHRCYKLVVVRAANYGRWWLQSNPCCLEPISYTEVVDRPLCLWLTPRLRNFKPT